MKKVVYKYGTGHPIPMNAKYLCTREETTETSTETSGLGRTLCETVKSNTLVWHYYELEIEEEI